LEGLLRILLELKLHNRRVIGRSDSKSLKLIKSNRKKRRDRAQFSNFSIKTT